MKSSVRFLLLAGLAIAATTLFYACQKETSGEDIPADKTKYSIFLSDGPTDYQKVLIDIQKIEIKLDTCKRNHNDDHDWPGCDDHHDEMHNCEIWQTLNINPGIYDLLKLRNGIDTLLASGIVLNGKLERIKFTLGSNNSVVADSVSHPLYLADNMNFVYVNVHREHLDSITSNNFQFFLDFNLDKSIKYSNGKYWLKPVIQPYGRHSTGEIEGKIRPVHSHWLIKAYNSTDTAYARPWEDEGEFKIRGLKEGTYNLYIDGINGYRDTTISNIVVRRARETELGTIQMHQ